MLDLCAAYAGRDETADLSRLVRLFAESVKMPIMIDSTTPGLHRGVPASSTPAAASSTRSTSRTAARPSNGSAALAKKYGAAVVALTINEQGMAMTAADKLATARQIYDLAVGEYGLRPQDILFDPLTFTIGAGDENLRDAAIQTLEGIRRIKQELPGVLHPARREQHLLRPAARRAQDPQLGLSARGGRGRARRGDHRRRQDPAAGPDQRGGPDLSAST